MREPHFRERYSGTEHEVFKIVSRLNHISHQRLMNANISARYRYNVKSAHTKSDVLVILAELFLDSQFLCNVLRLEYRSPRLAEAARVHGRALGGQIQCLLRLVHKGHNRETAPEKRGPSAAITLGFDNMIKAYQAEVWETLEPPLTCSHDINILEQMGRHRWITARKELTGPLHDINSYEGIDVVFREEFRDFTTGIPIENRALDNNYDQSVQIPRSPEPDSPENTMSQPYYYIPFFKCLYLDAEALPPVRYRNHMMDVNNSERRPDNIIEIRWLLQRRFGGRGIYFQEVTLPPGTEEGMHVYIGTEAMFYVIAGEGIAYLGGHDEPETAAFPTVQRHVLGVGVRPCKAVPLQPGKFVYLRSGAIKGLANPGSQPLRLVRIGIHSE